MSRPRLRLLLVAVAAACRPAPPPAPLPPGVEADVAYLASRALGGRAAGTAESDSAAAYIARRYEGLRLPGAFREACGAGRTCGASYFQRFDVVGGRAQNVAAVVAGTDSSLRDEYVVAGAHYDHLGTSTDFALDPAAGPVIRPGADDNASGTAALLELGRRLAARPPRRSVLLVHFDAEELGLIGSGVFVDRPPVPHQSMVLMVNLDMVGRLRGGKLVVDARIDAAGRALVDSAARAAGVRLVYSSATAGRSDHASFRRVRVPTIAFFTGFHADYHRASDIAARVDARGIERVVDVAEGVVRAAADREGRLAARR